MQEQIKKHFETLSNDELFYYFKFDGALDFNKKIVAGKVLFERAYDSTLLNTEKQKLKESIEKQIAEFEDKTNLEIRIRKEQKRGLVGIIFSALATLTVYALCYFDASEMKTTLKYLLIAAFIIFPLSWINRIRNFNKGIQEEMEQAKKDNRIHHQKLEKIEKEWQFS
jgi:hypothetical protein